MKINPNKTFLFLILLFSLIIRLYKLNLLPLFADELDVGNQAYSLLTTARDCAGNFLPSYLQSFNEWRAPLLIYTTLPFVAIFGRTTLAIRLAPIIFGLLSIFFLYKLVLKLSQKPSLALVSASLLSLSPWHFHYSRTSFEVTLLITLILSACFYFFQKRYFISCLLFTLSFYTYNTANVFVPLLLIFLFISLRPQIKLPSFLPLLLLVPLAFQIISGSAAKRFSQVSIFQNQNEINQIIFKRTGFSSSLSVPERLFHNKGNSWLKQFSQNYLSAISPSFFFVSGDPNPRHSLPEFGLLCYALVIPLALGLIKANYRQVINRFMIFFLITAPIPSSLTQDGANHATRLFLLLPPLSYFSALGIFYLKRNFKSIFVVFLILSLHYLINFVHEYFVHYPKENFEYWQYGQEQLFSSLPQNAPRYFISNTTYSSLKPFIFFQNSSALLTQKPSFTDQEKTLDFDLLGFMLDDRIFFVNNWQNNDPLAKISTFAQSGDAFLLYQLKDIPGDWDFTKTPLSNFKTIKTVYNPNQSIFGQIIQKI